MLVGVPIVGRAWFLVETRVMHCLCYVQNFMHQTLLQPEFETPTFREKTGKNWMLDLRL